MVKNKQNNQNNNKQQQPQNPNYYLSAFTLNLQHQLTYLW